jgi:2-isopropylmalate synthase
VKTCGGGPLELNMACDRVRIFDTTLRDGLRGSGISMSLAEKIGLARQLERLGVDVIEIGFGGPREVEPMRQIGAAVEAPVVVALSRTVLKDVDRALRGVETAKHPGINLFSPSSDALLGKSGASRRQALRQAADAARHAALHVEHVQFTAQDATRSDPVYLAELFAAAVEAGARVLSIADTVSHATPSTFGALCAGQRDSLGADVTWSVHCHNDRGLAVANCVAAIASGVRQLECTVGGVGERAGNTPLEGVLESLASERTAVAKHLLAETAALLRESWRAAGHGTEDLPD